MQRDYYPFGEVYDAAGNDDVLYQFTGKEFDTGVSLHYFGARYYDARIGRWLVLDPARQYFSPYVYAGNNPLVYVDPNGELAWFVPILVGAAVGGTAGGIIAHNNGQAWWKGAIVGGFIGAGVGSFAASVLGATGVGTASGWGTVTTALNSANWNMATAALQGGDVWKAGIAGFGTSILNTSGAFGLVKQGVAGRLSYQAITSAAGSISQNWVYGRGLFSRVTLGVGPVNLTVKRQVNSPVECQVNSPLIFG